MVCDGRVVVAGGAGALGFHLIRMFNEKNWWTCCIDKSVNTMASCNVKIEGDDVFLKQAESVFSETGKCLDGNQADAIICVAGGWIGGNAADDEFFKASSIMWQKSVWSSTIAAKLSSKYLKEGGLLILTGAAAALEGTPGMIGYGMAKAAVHQLTKSLGKKGSGMPPDSSAICILPVTLDTPSNRTSMPKANFSSWTSLEFLSDLIFKWCTSKSDRPASGSLLKLVTKHGNTEVINADIR